MTDNHHLACGTAKEKRFTLVALPVMSERKAKGFTLVELLVVVAIIALLLGILLPALGRASDIAKQTVCQSNMRQLTLGMTLYLNDHKRQFPNIGRTPLPDWESRNFPMEVLAIHMEWMDGELRDGHAAPKIVLCPSCGIQDDPRWAGSTMWGGQPPFNAPMRHYAMNGHLDTTNLTVDMRVTNECVGDGATSSPWPDFAGNTAHFQARNLASITHPAMLALFADSNEGAPVGYGTGHAYDWKMNSDRVRVSQRVPSRHAQGGNLGFLDGHVEWRSTTFLLDSANQDQWLVEANLGNTGVWSPW